MMLSYIIKFVKLSAFDYIITELIVSKEAINEYYERANTLKRLCLFYFIYCLKAGGKPARHEERNTF